VKYRVAAKNDICEEDQVEETVSIYPEFACPIASTSAGHNCGGYCYHARRYRKGKLEDHNGIDINGNNLAVTSPCGGDFIRRRTGRTCDPNRNADARKMNAGPGYGNYADVICTFKSGDRLTLRFAHLSSITHTGKKIAAGEEVGISDATGNACYCGPNWSVVDNPHLHFEVKGYDPKRFLPNNCPSENYSQLDQYDDNLGIPKNSSLRNRYRCCRANVVVERDCAQEPEMCPAQSP